MLDPNFDHLSVLILQHRFRCRLRFTWISPGSSFSSKVLTSFLLRESGLPSAPAYVSNVFIMMAMAVSSCVMVAGEGEVQSGERAQVARERSGRSGSDKGEILLYLLEGLTGSIGQVIVCFIRAVARTVSTQRQP